LHALEAQCPGVRGFHCDVTDKASVLRFAGAVLEEYRSVNLVISNAGGSREVDFNTTKMPAERLVRQTLAAVASGKTEVYPGAVRWPLLLRLAPGWAERIVAGT